MSAKNGLAVAAVAVALFVIIRTIPPTSTANPVSAPSTVDRVAARADYQEKAATVLAAMRDCAEQQAKTSDVLRALDRYAAYSAANEGVRHCEAMQAGLEKMTFGDIYEPAVAERLTNAVKDCGTALFSSAQGLKAVASAVDGEMKPSVLAEVNADYAAADDLNNRCISAMGDAARTSGLVTTAPPTPPLSPTEPEPNPTIASDSDTPRAAPPTDDNVANGYDPSMVTNTTTM